MIIRYSTCLQLRLQRQTQSATTLCRILSQTHWSDENIHRSLLLLSSLLFVHL